MYFNRRHDHLFQNRYKSIVCQEEVYLTEVVRCLHLNLLRCGREVWDYYGVTLDEMRSACLRQGLVEARGEMSRVAVRLFRYSGAEVARYLGVRNSYISQAVLANRITKEMLYRVGPS